MQIREVYSSLEKATKTDHGRLAQQSETKSNELNACETWKILEKEGFSTMDAICWYK